MTILTIDELKEDMILTTDVIDISGRLLLQKGQKLRVNHINIMRKWGITEVHVADSDTHEPNVIPKKDLNIPVKIGQETEHIFKYVDLDHPAMKELFRLSVLFRSEQGFSNGKANSILDKSIDHESHKTENVLKKLSQEELKFPEIPSIVLELNAIISDPLSTSDNLAQVVAKSPSLTAILLRIVNSSFYGFSAKIDTISRAVIGTREISSLALAICTISLFKDIPKEIVDMQSFLKHSFACGLISRMLTANRNIPQTEQMFVAGLLHDIGRLVIYKYFPEHASALLNRCISAEEMLLSEESDYLGCKHTDVSRYLLRTWNFPTILEDNIYYHHSPMDADKPVQAAIVHLADIMVNGLGIGSSGEQFVPPLDNQAWECLGLAPSNFEVITRQAFHQLSALELFYNNGG